MSAPSGSATARGATRKDLLLEVAVTYALGVGLVVWADRHPITVPVLGPLPLVLVTWIYLPMLVIRLRGGAPIRYGLDLGDWRGGLIDAVGALALLIPLYVLGHWLVRDLWQGLVIHLRWPPSLWTLVFQHVVLVAIAEELFFRGYVMTRLEEALGPDRRVLGGALGRTAVASAILFNVAHPLAGGQIWQGNVPFGIILAWLWTRRSSLVAPVLVHGLTNVVFLILESSVSRA